MAKLNLDALIKREDFEIEGDPIDIKQVTTMSMSNFTQESMIFHMLRKPDFQRETSDWSTEKVVGFIKSFVDGDLIPAVIMWQSQNCIFVIDGAHRLSALIAWVNDDYGDGSISRNFFERSISQDQHKAAERTRSVVKKEIGSYLDFGLMLRNEKNVQDKLALARAKRVSTHSIEVQWVRGDAVKAEKSFFNINQQAAPINPTELKLLQTRRRPNTIAARAIIRAGMGHKYWSAFTQEKQDSIESIAKNIHLLLFIPELQTPIKTLDLPVAGKNYSPRTLNLVFDFVNVTNHISTDDDLQNDVDGLATIRALKNTYNSVKYILTVR